MQDRIRDFFDSQAVLSNDEWTKFSSKLETKHFNKGAFLIQEGELENYLSFIVKGSVRCFTYNSKSEEISVGFASENNFSSSYSSFVSRKPSLISIQALEDSIVLRMSHKHLNEMYSLSHTGERLGRINAELFLTYREERELTLLTMNAFERYTHLLNTHPKLIQVVKLQHIATYLGITPQSLSRIRKQLVKT